MRGRRACTADAPACDAAPDTKTRTAVGERSSAATPGSAPGLCAHMPPEARKKKTLFAKRGSAIVCESAASMGKAQVIKKKLASRAASAAAGHPIVSKSKREFPAAPRPSTRAPETRGG